MWVIKKTCLVVDSVKKNYLSKIILLTHTKGLNQLLQNWNFKLYSWSIMNIPSYIQNSPSKQQFLYAHSYSFVELILSFLKVLSSKWVILDSQWNRFANKENFAYLYFANYHLHLCNASFLTSLRNWLFAGSYVETTRSNCSH